MRVVRDFEVVPIGAWAEYDVWYLGTLVMTHRIAVVARGPEGTTIERTIYGGMAGGRSVDAAVYVPAKGGGQQVSRMVSQVDENHLKEMFINEQTQRLYTKVDPSKFVGTEQVTVPAGTFNAKHYRDRTHHDEQLDYWIDETVWPIGLVKLEQDQKQVPTMGGRHVFQLVTTGNDARPQITHPLEPSGTIPGGVSR